MKLFFEDDRAIEPGSARRLQPDVRGETDTLTDVVLCAPLHLEAVPCCSVTQASMRHGFATSPDRAMQQHGVLRRALADLGVACHALPPEPGLADLCFTRDIAVATPWGLVALNPALPHRRREADHLVAAAGRWTTSPIARITDGTIEGGDVCIARPGLLIVGISGDRTDEAGAESLAARFRADGWDVLLYRFDPHFLHLDTIFCMIDPQTALACTDVLDDAFLEAVAARGISVLPVSYKEARLLGCNILSIDGRRVIAGAATPRVSAMMRQAGVDVREVDISEFSACGGGIHCLTMPLARSSR